MRAKNRSRSGRMFATLAPVALTAWSAMNGCSDDSFGTAAENDASSDVSSSDVATGDAAADVVVVVPFDGGACDLSKPFGSIKPINELNGTTTQQQTARLTHDELNIYFQQQAIIDSGAPPVDAGDGGFDAGPGPIFQLMTASRASIGATWGTPAPVSGLANPAFNETDPSVTPDNDTLYFGSSMTGSKGASDLWIATRTTPTTSFGPPANVSTLNTVNDESQPYVMPDGLSLYFRTKQAGGNFDLAYATRTATGGFALFTALDIFQNVNTPNVESLPTATFDELTLYFTSDRSAPASGARQIWKTTRSSKNDPFGNPVAVTELNTIGFIEPSWISDDGCRLYVTANVGGALNLYVTAKPAN